MVTGCVAFSGNAETNFLLVFHQFFSADQTLKSKQLHVQFMVIFKGLYNAFDFCFQGVKEVFLGFDITPTWV